MLAVRPHAAVDVVDAADARRTVEAREARSTPAPTRDRERAVLVVAEDDALGGVEVHRDDVELFLRAWKSALKLFGMCRPLEVVAQIVLDGRVVEEARRQIVERERERSTRDSAAESGRSTSAALASDGLRTNSRIGSAMLSASAGLFRDRDRGSSPGMNAARSSR
jgi:hypothetical protein